MALYAAEALSARLFLISLCLDVRGLHVAVGVAGCDGRYESYTVAAVFVGEGEEMWGMGILVGGKYLQVVGAGGMIWTGKMVRVVGFVWCGV